MSKRVKRMPWQEPEPEERAPTPMSIGDLPEDGQQMLALRPCRNPAVEWEEDKETGRVTLIYPKSFSTFERTLGRMLPPVREIRRPLDGPGSFIWLMMDGQNDLATICTAVDGAYKEEMEPILRRVLGFIVVLAKRGLAIMERGPDEG